MIFFGGLLADPSVEATIYSVGNNSALSTALGSVNPGDSIVISNGNYSGFTITRSGTAANPITIQAQNLLLATNNTGIIKFAGVANVTLSGLTLTMSGGSLTVDGTSHAVGVVLTNCVNCRVTHCNFKLAGAASGTAWVMIGGPSYSNRVDHCDFGPNSVSGHTHFIWPVGNATIAGVTAPSDRMPWALGYGPFNPNIARYTHIDHNNFHDQASGVGEVMVLGAFGETGDYQDIYTLIEYNHFSACNGDPEIISSKSSNNTMRFNTVTNSFGRFSLRAGNNDSVYGNFFFGSADGTAWSGVKVDERDQKIFNNYIESTSNYPLIFVSGSLYNFGFQQAQVVRAQIVHNTIVNPAEAFQLGLGSGLPPADCVIANNLITGSGTLYSEGVTPLNPVRSQNIIYGYTPSQSGFLVENPQLTGSSPERLSAFSPAINNANTNLYPYVTDDMDGQTRSIPRDIGADEYFSSASFIARPPLTPNETGPNSVDIELSATPLLQTVSPGATNTSYTINVTSDAGFTNTVTLTASGLLPGMSAGFNPPTVNGSGAVTLNVTNTSSVLGGNYPFIITATSSNLQSSATVNLQVGRGASNLRWASTGSGVWNVQTTSNWFNFSSSVADVFYSGDTILLDDSNSVQTGLTIAAGVAVSPSIITNNSSTNNFTISGAGKITGPAKFVKTGTSTLTVNTTNDFSGGMLIAGGILKAGNSYALGGQSGFIILTNGGTLDVNGFNLGLDAVLVSGAGVSNNGAIINSGGDIYPALAVIELAGNTSIGGTHRWDLRATSGNGTASLSASGNVYNLTKVGTNFIGIVDVSVDPSLGDINVQAGTLDIEATTTCLGNPANTLTVFTNATLEFWNTVYNTNYLNLDKFFALNDGATILNGSGANFLIGQITLNGNDCFSIAGTSLTCSNNLAGSGNLIKIGGSPLNLAGINTFTGNMIVSNGTLGVVSPGTISGTPAITISSGATLSVSGTVSGGGNFISGGTLAMNGGTLQFSISSGVTNANVSTLSFGGTGSTINVTALPLITSLPAQFPLIKFSSESGAFNFAAGTIAGGYSGFISNNTAKSTVDLVITNSQPLLEWNGANSAEWNLASANWSNSISTASPVAYQDPNIAIFDDSITNAPTVRTNIDFAPGVVVQPGAVIVNSTVNYAIGGAGKISGGALLLKQGAGVLTLNSTNDFTGGVTISGGVLKPGNTNALGSTAAATVITNGGTLDVNALALNARTIIVSGAGNTNGGAIINTAGSQTSALRTVTLAGNTTFGGPGIYSPGSAGAGRWDIRNTGGTASLGTGGQPWKLTKTGSNQVSLVAVQIDPALGDIDIQQGLLGFETSTTSMGNPASNLIVRAGATLSFFNSTSQWSKVFTFYGNGSASNIYNWSGNNTMIGPVTLNGDCVFAIPTGALTNHGVIGGTGGLVKSGTSPLILTAANSYSGDTSVNQGMLQFIGSGSVSGSATITVSSGATLDASGRGDATLTLASGQSLKGKGTLNGTVNVGSGAILAPGNSIGILTFNNNLMLNGGSTTFMELNKTLLTNDAAQVAGTLTYGGTLSLTNLSGMLTNGDSFRLFKAATYMGAFTNIIPAIPAVNLAWNTNSLTNGVLGIVSGVKPVPRITGISLSGTVLTIIATNGATGGQYALLQSTNVAQPLARWLPVTTNNFDGSGSFSLTNTVDPNAPQSFYIIQSQ